MVCSRRYGMPTGRTGDTTLLQGVLHAVENLMQTAVALRPSAGTAVIARKTVVVPSSSSWNTTMQEQGRANAADTRNARPHRPLDPTANGLTSGMHNYEYTPPQVNRGS